MDFSKANPVILVSTHLFKLAKFIGTHTMWIYLWHIPFVVFLGNRFNAPIRYSLILIGALLVSSLQFYLVNLILSHIRNPKLKKRTGNDI